MIKLNSCFLLIIVTLSFIIVCFIQNELTILSNSSSSPLITESTKTVDSKSASQKNVEDNFNKTRTTSQDDDNNEIFKSTSSTVAPKANDYSTNNKKKIKTRPKKYFIMHIGPPKTGTTTIQCKLDSLHMQKLLPSNVTLMTKIHRTSPCNNNKTNEIKFTREDLKSSKFANCLGLLKYSRKTESLFIPKCWKRKVMPFLKRQAKLQNSIVIIQETLSLFYTRKIQIYHHLLKILHELDYTVIVLYTYRKFFDLIYSHYGQHFRAKREFQHELKGFSFEEYLNESNHYEMYYESIQYFNSSDSNSKPYIEEFKVLNMDQDNLEEQFFCHALPPEFNLCDLALQEKQLDSNKAVDYFWCDLIATGMLARQKIELTHKNRNKVLALRSKIIEKQTEEQKTCYDFPKICPSEEYITRIWKESIHYHEYVFQNRTLLELVKDGYQNKFDSMRFKFCTVDVEEVLKDEKWTKVIGEFF